MFWHFHLSPSHLVWMISLLQLTISLGFVLCFQVLISLQNQVTSPSLLLKWAGFPWQCPNPPQLTVSLHLQASIHHTRIVSFDQKQECSYFLWSVSSIWINTFYWLHWIASIDRILGSAHFYFFFYVVSGLFSHH